MISVAEQIETLVFAMNGKESTSGRFGYGYRDAEGHCHVMLTDGQIFRIWSASIGSAAGLWHVQKLGGSLCGCARSLIDACHACVNA